jgi:hypothetical protein
VSFLAAALPDKGHGSGIEFLLCNPAFMVLYVYTMLEAAMRNPYCPKLGGMATTELPQSQFQNGLAPGQRGREEFARYPTPCVSGGTKSKGEPPPQRRENGGRHGLPDVRGLQPILIGGGKSRTESLWTYGEKAFLEG